MRRLPILIPHRPGCADFPLPVLHGRASLAEVQMTPSVTCRQRTTRGRTSAFVSILASSATRCRFVDRFVRLKVLSRVSRASALNEFRGSITRLRHLLPTLQDWCCHHPCKARFRLAGSPLPGGSRTLRIATKGFRSQSHPPFLDLSWRKGSFILNLPLA